MDWRRNAVPLLLSKLHFGPCNYLSCSYKLRQSFKSAHHIHWRQFAVSAVSILYTLKTYANFCDSSFVSRSLQYKLAVIAALVASASAFAPSTQITRSTAIGQHIGAGGMADTRNPEPKDDEDPRKSISAAPSFEEYLKQRAAEGN